MSDASSKTVLCVDDEPKILSSLKRLLRSEDCEIVTATSGREGLDLLMEHKPCLVISDQKMPGMLGTEFLRQVKERCPEAICVIVSGFAERSDIDEGLEQGHVSGFLAKPWDNKEFLALVRAHI